MAHTNPWEIQDHEFAEAVRVSSSVCGAVQYLGRARVGTNLRLVRSAIDRLELDTSHWRNKQTVLQKHATNSILISDNTVGRQAVKALIIREKLLPYACAECNCGPEWRDKPLVLRLDHINGIRNDDRIENLRFLCPNCDSQTPTFCGRNKKRIYGVNNQTQALCVDCGKARFYKKAGERCTQCAAKHRHNATKIDWPATPDLITRIEASSILAVARSLGVSDNAVRKRLRKHAA